ncbi:MAG: hypothetical protein ACYDA0_12530 [Candidatus Dormibacteraceae bacterium]
MAKLVAISAAAQASALQESAAKRRKELIRACFLSTAFVSLVQLAAINSTAQAKAVYGAFEILPISLAPDASLGWLGAFDRSSELLAGVILVIGLGLTFFDDTKAMVHALWALFLVLGANWVGSSVLVMSDQPIGLIGVVVITYIALRAFQLTVAIGSQYYAAYKGRFFRQTGWLYQWFGPPFAFALVVWSWSNRCLTTPKLGWGVLGPSLVLLAVMVILFFWWLFVWFAQESLKADGQAKATAKQVAAPDEGAPTDPGAE